MISVPYDENDKSPCEGCKLLTEWSKRQIEKAKGVTMAGHPEFYKILEELKELHDRKNSDYADTNPLGNLEMCELGGLPGWKGVIVRLTDKMARLLTFMKKEEYKVKDESVEDTFRDMAVYAIIGLILYRESKKKEII